MTITSLPETMSGYLVPDRSLASLLVPVVSATVLNIHIVPGSGVGLSLSSILMYRKSGTKYSPRKRWKIQ
jgi:hypothetical protein